MPPSQVQVKEGIALQKSDRKLDEISLSVGVFLTSCCNGFIFFQGRVGCVAMAIELGILLVIAGHFSSPQLG